MVATAISVVAMIAAPSRSQIPRGAPCPELCWVTVTAMFMMPIRPVAPPAPHAAILVVLFAVTMEPLQMSPHREVQKPKIQPSSCAAEGEPRRDGAVEKHPRLVRRSGADDH